MSQSEVGVIFNAQTARFHFLQHCRVVDPVDNRSLDVLTARGFVRRERSAIPVYVITDKGREALRHRQAPEELADSDTVSQGPIADKCTVELLRWAANRSGATKARW
jgi:hypothetical protein